MNRKQLTLLAALVVIIGGLGWLLHHRRSASWKESGPETGAKLLPAFPLNDVAQIVVHQTNATLHLVKQDDRWRVQERYNYPANFREISEFLRKMWEIKGLQQIKVGPSQLGRLELLPPSSDTNAPAGTNTGTLVEFRDKDGKTIQSLLLGKKHMRKSADPSPMGDDSGWPDGRYVLVGADANPVVWVINDPLTSIEPKPESWLNKDFLKVEKLRGISLAHTNATNSWKVTRESESAEWKLDAAAAGEQIDPSKTSSLNWLLSSASYNDVLPPNVDPEGLGLAQPIVARLETFDNFSYELQIGAPTNNDNYPVRVKASASIPAERTPGKDEKAEDKERLDKEFKEKNDKLKEKLQQEKDLEPWTFLVSKWTFDALLKNRADLLKSPDTNAAASASEPEQNGPPPMVPGLPGAPAAPGVAPLVVNPIAISNALPVAPPTVAPAPSLPPPLPPETKLDVPARPATNMAPAALTNKPAAAPSATPSATLAPRPPAAPAVAAPTAATNKPAAAPSATPSATLAPRPPAAAPVAAPTAATNKPAPAS
ncbi:MAG TPA: DUF4340 domain-containing protein [Candidatus Paceibacterota bacterium]|nr:DUF4340 domain-containing protein [Candidatus Paceibacterota bacterium]